MESKSVAYDDEAKKYLSVRFVQKEMNLETQ